jgi:hypothetical protein
MSSPIQKDASAAMEKLLADLPVDMEALRDYYVNLQSPPESPEINVYFGEQGERMLLEDDTQKRRRLFEKDHAALIEAFATLYLISQFGLKSCPVDHELEASGGGYTHVTSDDVSKLIKYTSSEEADQHRPAVQPILDFIEAHRRDLENFMRNQSRILLFSHAAVKASYTLDNQLADLFAGDYTHELNIRKAAEIYLNTDHHIQEFDAYMAGKPVHETNEERAKEFLIPRIQEIIKIIGSVAFHDTVSFDWERVGAGQKVADVNFARRSRRNLGE